jgi:hypothetical protein
MTARRPGARRRGLLVAGVEQLPERLGGVVQPVIAHGDGRVGRAQVSDDGVIMVVDRLYQAAAVSGHIALMPPIAARAVSGVSLDRPERAA